ncbi:hypothetical protein COT75_02250 [Candidatus Beckwithbacteria bacterium CG10_big_fil_rev_8_21_14_0_10_34_10]|uniref:Uncharacterized protein n=1 Tax=Candidatus Beckwithbacteria bacterium CG10_big_fil_rev_8_21_14_0_10_34_10 TaxID=1974495 RepID=A0A2H0W9R9_9BACT|nr:MAG: hypothetical protein COT75_02250 [Candidatus Beckwithbacteria bacterium CG10_big_fil_rev_8_21_14_0_10_34_10]
MSDLNNNNVKPPVNNSPSSPEELSLPPWMETNQNKPTKTTLKNQPLKSSKPTLGPIIEPSNPTGPPVEQTSFSKPAKKTKISKPATFGGLALVALFLGLISYSSFNSSKKESIPEEQKDSPVIKTSPSLLKKTPVQLPAEPIYEEKGDFALSVNKEQLSWEEYKDFLDYQLYLERSNVNKNDVRESLNQNLIERLIIKSAAKELNLSFSPEDLKKAEKSYYGTSISPDLKTYPEVQEILKAQALKEKIIEKKVTWITGGSMIVEMAGPDVLKQAFKEQLDPKQLALRTITPYHDRAKNEEGIKRLIDDAWQDNELLKINGNPQATLFEMYYQDLVQKKPPHSDPQFTQILFSLNSGETSEIFIIKQSNDEEKDLWVDYGYAFIKIEQAFKGEFENFQAWLNQELEKAEIISNL